ncbi:hypothetical protein A2331_03990 [Candidatus Falkowbacteria bacterium RIFOXYB2_FULL_34_18]|uniref:N-acetyltransferase domain-containing protein n=1 Tax=Candidatus Falkowbacteria bacterium RIFOXYD2_FULL_34_120 TaxID=1798007 RepID=A0A1F5TP88_9BACT|nr:MAG: hypothetical protein A2331_03990 [Candidatus Falkowbacteria bacterium RIFOXYB2_FULL_34_18]OGF29112.1 MAG: hypothetical protein A2500_03315 [Candidatus Falkowbacteria bacterium RIFOXYC12_FULL_34_55]OGF36195.1 MAG: hypothetical protein A2466_04845 [Candidatus Falkowbacteria bacterium RIFOXYC2_FULL_34_220]OGF38622.1 MAG: hypothetical protein A2515_02205 [Candidatus Falkowbacteria bacterium RIFOXYD12_FULL_34_57]OGF40805.1 MAG: hypothetical protein A2531_06850 [Candidatus Falkowbacteria bact
MKFRKLQLKDEKDLLQLLPQLTNRQIILNAKELIRNKNCHSIVIEHEKKVIGFGQIYVCPTPVEGYFGIIENIIVDKSFRKMGLGKKIMEKLIEIGKKNGAKKIDLTSNPSRIEARNLYESLGFQLRNTGIFRLKL